MDISPSYPLYTIKRNHFAKRFFETAPTLPEKSLHHRSQSRFGWNRSPPKHTLKAVVWLVLNFRREMEKLVASSRDSCRSSDGQKASHRSLVRG
jgi:hypothetical protein